MKKAFTMIEIIFVIVMIGILASIALPRFSATKDDAKIVTELSNLRTCISDVASSYLAVEEENNNSTACKILECANVNFGNLNDGNISISFQNSYSGKLNYCNRVKELAIKRDLIGNFSFGGTKVAF